MTQGKPYSLLGKALDEMARNRNVRGPYGIAGYVRERTGEGPNGSAWSQILYGETRRPRPETMTLFARAFELSEVEMDRLAYVYTFASEPPGTRATDGPSV